MKLGELLTEDTSKPLLNALLLGAASLLLWLWERKPRTPSYPTVHDSPYAWHTCFGPDCAELIRPKELMCAEHQEMLPAPLRMKIAELERTGGWQERLVFAKRAIDFLWEYDKPHEVLR